MKSITRARRAGLVVLSALGLFAVQIAAGALSACGGADTTSSKRVALKTEVTTPKEATAAFTNAYGWSIQLSHAWVSVGPLYYFDGAPIFSAMREDARGAPSRFAGLGMDTFPEEARGLFDHLLGVPAAHAHPGHYQAGNAMGQELKPTSVDLLTGPAALAAGDGVAGIYRSARFIFQSPPSGPGAMALGAHVVVLEGEADKDADKRPFRASAAVSDVLDSYNDPKLEGCAFDKETDVEADGTITVTIDPRVWLDQADFASVAASADGAPVDLSPDEEAFKAFARGLKKGAAVLFHYAP